MFLETPNGEVKRKENSERIPSNISRNPVRERMQKPKKYASEQRSLWWQSELKRQFEGSHYQDGV